MKLSRKVLCVDWDKRSLRFVVARVGGSAMHLEDAHSHRVPSSIDVDDPAAMGGFIAQLLKRHGWRYKRVILDVPRDRAVINRLTLPPTPVGELASAVRFQALKELPFPLDEAQIDFAILQRDDSGLVTEVLLAAVRLEMLERLRETCRVAGLTPARIGLRPYANMVSIGRIPGLEQRRVLLVDVGPATTEIDVVRGSTLAFSRSATVTVPPLPGEMPSEDSRVSSKADSADVLMSEEAGSSAVADLLVEVTRTLQAYRATEPNSGVDEIVIAGGTGIESELLEAVSNRFGLPSNLFDPTTVLRLHSSEATKLRAFSAALGLAWGLGRDNLLELDFLNPKRPIAPQASLKRRLRVGAAALVVLIVLGVGWTISNVFELRAELAQLDAEVNPQSGTLAKKVIDLRRLKATAEEVQDWEAVSHDAVWLDHLLTLSREAAGPEGTPGKQMIVQSLALNQPIGTIGMRVLASDFEVASGFVARINDFRYEGQRIYKAEPGRWEPTNEDPAFAGRVDISITLLELADQYNGAKARERKRAESLKIKTGA